MSTTLSILSIFLLSLTVPTLCQTSDCKTNYFCTEDFCSSECGPKDCFVPGGEECQGILLPLYDNGNDFCSCCPWRCVQYLGQGEICSPKPTTPYPTEMCGEQLSCQMADGDTVFRCIPTDTNCMKEFQEYQDNLDSGTLGMNESPPSCDEDGLYSPVQCIRGGLCRCVNKYSGDPIFGVTGGEVPSMEEKQNCQCASTYFEALQQACRMHLTFESKYRVEQYKTAFDLCVEQALTSSAIDNVYFPGHMRCLSNGNFDPIQCVDRSVTEDMCFCIDADINLNSTITYQSLINNLPCYSEDLHVPEYFRPCEAKTKMMKERMEELEEDEIDFYSGGSLPICSPDGYYDKVQHDSGNFLRLFCSDRHGYQIDSYEADMSLPEGQAMNCECAYTRENLSEGVPKPSCCPNGNFEPYQCQAGKCYCVDKFGRQTDLEVDQLDISSLNCTETCV